MMANQTLLDDLLSLDIPSTSVAPFLRDIKIDENSVLPTDDSFPSPADPFEGDSSFVNITEISNMANPSNGTTSVVTFQDLYDFVDDNSWVIYVVIIIGVLIVINIMVAIILWIYNHKKRLITQRDDPMLSSNYEQGVRWRKLCCCCCCGEKRQDNVVKIDQRQNSASNLEAYGRREPLPAIAYQNPTAVEQEIIKAPRNEIPTDNSHLAVHIEGIKDVPATYIPTSEYRELPPLRLPRTNVYHNY